MGTVPLLHKDALAPKARAAFDDIWVTHGTEFINKFRPALAQKLRTLEAVWLWPRPGVAPGAHDPLTKKPIYNYVSSPDRYDDCIHSQKAAAKAGCRAENRHHELDFGFR